MDEEVKVIIGNPDEYGKPVGTLLVRAADDYYGFEELEWAPEEFWDWYCDNRSGILYIYDEGTGVIAEFELEHLSEVIFIRYGGED